MDRRKYIASIGTLGTVAITGCISGIDSGNGEDSDANGDNGENSSQATTHQIGDTFEIGEGESAIEYTITSTEKYDEIGSERDSEEADNTFLLIFLEITAPSDENPDIEMDNFELQDSDGNSYFDEDISIQRDDRIDTEPLSQYTGIPIPLDVALVYDVPEGSSVDLLIRNPGEFDTGETHTVEIGEI